MKKINVFGLVAMSALICFLSACGGEPQVTVLEACATQETEDDCLMIGQNILALSEEFSRYECVWQNNQCVSQLIPGL